LAFSYRSVEAFKVFPLHWEAGVGADDAVVIRHSRVLSNQSTPYPLNRRPILPTDAISPQSALETTQGQTDGFFSKLPFKCYLPEVASVGESLKFAPGLPPGWCRVRAYVAAAIDDAVRHARVLYNQPPSYPTNRYSVLPTDVTSSQCKVFMKR